MQIISVIRPFGAIYHRPGLYAKLINVRLHPRVSSDCKGRHIQFQFYASAVVYYFRI